MERKCDWSGALLERRCCYTVRAGRSQRIVLHIMSSLRQFRYRSPRFECTSRVDFISGDTIFLGCCTEISDSGLRVTFEDTVPSEVAGLITLYADGKGFSAHALILEVHDKETTAKFQFLSQHEAIAIRDFIRLLTL